MDEVVFVASGRKNGNGVEIGIHAGGYLGVVGDLDTMDGQCSPLVRVGRRFIFIQVVLSMFSVMNLNSRYETLDHACF